MRATHTELTVTPLGNGIGAQIDGVNLCEPISANTREAIISAWMQHKVLRFRGRQGMSTQQLVDFSKIFGELDRAPTPANKTGKPYLAEFPNVTAISNIVVDGQPIGGLGAYEAEWHTDMSYNERTPIGSLLYALEVPPAGGDTGFSNMYEAYDTLPAELRRAIATLQCRHDSSRNSAGELRKGFKDFTDPRDAPGAIHPLIRTHPVTRRNALFLGRRRNAWIVGLPLRESEDLLDTRWAHAAQQRFAWYQQRKVSDLILWDNRCAMHRRDAFDPESRRLMHRTQIKGDKPFFDSTTVAA